MEDTKENSRKNKNIFNPVLSVGIVGHCSIEELPELKHLLESLDSFDLVFFKTASGKLWIKEGDSNE